MMKQGFIAILQFEALAVADSAEISLKRRRSLNGGGISGHKR
jgi:hypothetical protein